MDHVHVNGIDLAWTDHAGPGATLLLVHGFTGSSLDWTDVVPLLTPHVRVVTVDQRGHGETTNTGDPAGYTLAQLVDDLSGFVDAVGLDRFHLLGHSMGGMVVVRWALAHQDRLRSLVLMDTSAEPLTGAERMFAPMIELARTQGMARLIEAMEKFTPAPVGARGDEIRARNRWKLEHMDPVAFATLAHELSTAPGVLDRLSTINVPTTVLVGEDDAPFIEPSAQMTAAIPGAQQVTFAGAGHCPNEDDPAAWTAAVFAHLDRAKASGASGVLG